MRIRLALAVFVGGTAATIALSSCASSRASFADIATDEAGGPVLVAADAADVRACEGLACQQQDCAGGSDTVVTGTVYAPNGELPLFNAIVYVPTEPLEDVRAGATCDPCGVVSGSPLVSALTDATGKFSLKHMPVGKDIPLVIQVGKWRRQTTIAEVKACEETKLTDPDLTRLPKNRKEGSLPSIALTTGLCDKVGCMLPGIGIDDSEFGTAADGPSKAVHVFKGYSGPSAPSWPSAETLWSDVEKLRAYDMIVLSCECDEYLENKGGSPTGKPFAAMTEYLKTGGRIFTTDFQYTWYRYTPDAELKAATKLRGNSPIAEAPILLDTSFPKGAALKQWFDLVVPGSNGNVAPEAVYANVVSIDPTKTQQWGSGGGGDLAGTRIFSVNVPVGAPAPQQCGKGVHVDAHLNESVGDVNAVYPSGCSSTLTPGLKLLAFFFFDLASCIQDETEPPKPPAVK